MTNPVDKFNREWQVIPEIKARVKSINNIKTVPSWSGPFGNANIQRQEYYQGVQEFTRDLKVLINNITGKTVKNKLKFALKWIPKAAYFSKSPFAIFLMTRRITPKMKSILEKTNLIHGTYGNFSILSTGHDFEIYSSVIDFFYRFRFIVSKKSKHIPILLRDITGKGGNRAFLLFTSINGHGLLIKVLDKDYGGGINKELDIMRIGKIIKANIPKNAMIIHNTGAEMFKSLGKEDFFIETLTPVSFQLQDADNWIIDEIISKDSINLGRLLVFNIACGSWDRHQGNYLINQIKNKYSLQEIDFGLFQSDFNRIEEENFQPDDEAKQNKPSKYPKYLGWAITRHPKVESIMRKSNEREFIIGVLSSLKKLHSALTNSETGLDYVVGPKILNRIRGIFQENSSVQKLLLQDLDELGKNTNNIIKFLEKANL
ncbi:MAG: hypothetical protein ACFFD1_02240 [Candidatus Thorarchaeota archaeon]